ncbi:MAG: DNA-directed RNA polymerase subunit beta, partial [Patescibacteria group bacterium]
MEKKYFSRYQKPLLDLPNLIKIQKDSYQWLLSRGLKDIFSDFSPIKDYSEKKFELSFLGFSVDPPRFDEYHAVLNQLSYDTPLRVRIKLLNKILKQEKEQEIFMADFPLMTGHGTFVINGNERVVVPQLARSYGVFFTENEIRGRKYFGAKIIPSGGAWVEFETEADDCIWVRIDRKRKFPFSYLLKVFADLESRAGSPTALKRGGPAGHQAITNDEIKALLEVKSDRPYAEKTLARDTTTTVDEVYLEIYRRLRDADLASAAPAREFITSLFSREKYDLSAIGRLRLNKRFEHSPLTDESENRTLTFDDLVVIVRHIITLSNTPEAVGDDIDHLGLRRVRGVGEMLQQKLRIGMIQMKRNIQDRMSTIDSSAVLPIQFLSPRPLQARLKEFFTTNQLSQFMNQKNLLSEIEHLRTLSALGPGGLTRKRSGLEVRDVHTSHYGRICPIHTPEGPNIGLILHLANYARINEFGIIETPYRKVKNGQITEEIVYLNALEEETQAIAHGSVPYDGDRRLVEEQVEVRLNTRPTIAPRDQVNLIEVAPYQPFSVGTSLVPFLEHDDANRA